MSLEELPKTKFDKLLEERFQSKTREDISKLSLDEAKDRLRVLENKFQKISEDPNLDEGGGFYTARQPIDAERTKIFDQFPELEEWYENEL